MRLGYLYSRYPVLSQTFCDMEMLDLERRGFKLVIGAIHPPLTSLRHAHVDKLRAPIEYAPPAPIMQIWEKRMRERGKWPQDLIDAHEKKFGAKFKSALRARNACYFAELFCRHGVEHCHVHFANRAAHTALFLKAMTGISFSVTAHGQDFMADLGNDDLLREICAAAKFVAVETEYSRNLLQERCPESAQKIHRVYNGMDLSSFPKGMPAISNDRVRIVSVGRLVEFKGFQNLIAACAQLRDKQLDFSCEIIGDGPLREELQTQIAQLHLENIVILRGALSQEEVIRALQQSDIFALAAIVDRLGASDVFPTVIQEAMAAEKPVVSTTLAGIPETVLNEKTGLLVSPGNIAGLTDALEKLIRDRELRLRFGATGRQRIEENFQIAKTIEPLIQLFQNAGRSVAASPPPSASKPKQIAYLLDLWPDRHLQNIERELAEMERREIPITALACRLSADVQFTPRQKNTAMRLQFLPDATVVEAEWLANQTLAHELENDRANSEPRAPSDLFLEQARFAIMWRKLLREENISHLHATSSRVLFCAVFLKKMLGVTLSATIEATPILSQPLLQSALRECVGGRIADRKLQAALPDIFLREGSNGLTGRGHFWQEWSERLAFWNNASPQR